MPVPFASPVTLSGHKQARLRISISNAVLGRHLHPAPLLGEPVVSASTPRAARRRKMLRQGAEGYTPKGNLVNVHNGG